MLLLRSMYRHASASRIPSPQARAAAGRPPAGPAGRPKARGASGVQLRIADRLFARQCHCSNPCNATHQASRIPRPQARAAARSPQPGPAGQPKARRSEWHDGSKWLIRYLLANAAAPIQVTPLISLHESRAPKREPLPGARRAVMLKMRGSCLRSFRV